jgi:hypothetical protein
LNGANSFAKIGVFNTSTDGFFGEDNRVTAFDAQANDSVLFPFQSSAVQFSHPIDLTATYTVQNVNVSDTFTLAFSTKARASRGEFDILGTPSFDLPNGVLLSSARALDLLPELVYLVDNVGVTDLTGVSMTGNVIISDNANLNTVSMSDLSSVTGTVEISDNAATGVIDLSGLETAGGSVAITSNEATGVIDLSSLESVTGDVTITDNGNASVSMSSLDSVTGNITLESTGTGSFSIGSPEVTGEVELTLTGYTTVSASTGGGATGVIMINNEATMEVTRPDGAFASETPVAFSITSEPGSVEAVDGNTVTHLATYSFEFAVPTLDSAAELNFEINLAAMDEPTRMSLLDLLHDGALLTLGVRGDEPGAELQLFDVCASGGPVADSCVVVHWLDENRTLLDPLGGIDPSFLRLEGLVGQFSTYSFVAVTAVPEPNGLVLPLLAAAFGALRRRR